ncbi:hypothetical protein JCM10908_002071 [Rhodotorula pacifica]|uniref:putative metallocarboxypeptidase n=1 Tax=Rhodotorula pacifica TaxID=1495444 RepID=UPI003179F3C7
MRLKGGWTTALGLHSLAATVQASAVPPAVDFVPSAPLTHANQLTFTAPVHTRDYGNILQLEYDRRESLEQAIERFEEQDVDIWFAGKRRSSQGRVGWHAFVRQETSLDASLEAAAAAAEQGAVSGTAVPVQELFAQNPTLSTSYSRALSAASVANLTQTPHSASAISLDDPIHDTYHPYDSIHAILIKFQEAFPGWVKVFSLGQSSEGREIWAVKVTKPSSGSSGASEGAEDSADESEAEQGEADAEEEDEEDSDEEDSVGPAPMFSMRLKGNKHHKHKGRRNHPRHKLKFVVAGTQHSREWIAASTVLYLVHNLVALDEHGKVPHRKLLEQVEFTFVPVVNPDGYVYAWEHDRLWRKSRQPVSKPPPPHTDTTSSDDCVGIDLNRNWGYKFQPGVRPNPCSDSYPGAKAFDSVELQALRDYMLNGTDAFLDVHSFGQMLLFPYSYSCNVETHDQENHYEAVLQAAKALRDVHGRVFETGSVCEVSLTSPGESLDWAYAVAKIRWSFATELRDGGIFGFLLPPSQIRPSGEEMSAALHRLTQFVLAKEAGKR